VRESGFIPRITIQATLLEDLSMYGEAGPVNIFYKLGAIRRYDDPTN
jgi:hypothetical protein